MHVSIKEIVELKWEYKAGIAAIAVNSLLWYISIVMFGKDPNFNNIYFTAACSIVLSILWYAPHILTSALTVISIQSFLAEDLKNTSEKTKEDEEESDKDSGQLPSFTSFIASISWLAYFIFLNNYARVSLLKMTEIIFVVTMLRVLIFIYILRPLIIWHRKKIKAKIEPHNKVQTQ
tara:strand:- start:120 stop:650 length:531 start_codon:yes stop_codon:yes gene_type:complete